MFGIAVGVTDCLRFPTHIHQQTLCIFPADAIASFTLCSFLGLFVFRLVFSSKTHYQLDLDHVTDLDSQDHSTVWSYKIAWLSSLYVKDHCPAADQELCILISTSDPTLSNQYGYP